MTDELFRADAYARSCAAAVIASDATGIELDRTVFYPMGGGQPGDTGRLVWSGGETPIVDTRKGAAPGQILHLPAPGAPLPPPHAAVEAVLDWERRHRLMRMHTALHLLSAVLPYPVTGGQVGDGSGRLDFDAADKPEKDPVAAQLNALIAADHPVRMRWVTEDELAANPDLVKTMAVKPPSGQGRVRLIEVAGLERPIDIQACGGTHVARTGEIGPLIVRKIESKGRQNRRVQIEFA